MRNSRVRKLVVTTMLGVVGFVLMLLNFPIPLMPPFIKMDFSELPALIGSFALGPLWGAAVCVIKNVLKAVFSTSTFGVGELSNILLGTCLVVPAGLVYQRGKTRRGAILGALAGILFSGIMSVAVNYFITYPFYTQFMPLEGIMAMYQAINPRIETLLEALIRFNAPFTAVKHACSSGLCVLIYKKLSPILHGRQT